MKCLCITGAEQGDLDVVKGILMQAGMEPAQPSGRDSTITIDYWHEQVLKQLQPGKDEASQPPGSKPGLGKLWEQLSSDIFVANMGAGLWGWSNPGASALLEYWAEFERNLNFVLVCVHPAYVLAKSLESSEEPPPVDAIMDAWLATHEESLRFFHRNSGRCLLVSLQDCIADPSGLVEATNKHWQLGLVTDTLSTQPTPAASLLAIHLAEQMVSHYPHALALQQEIESTVTRLSKATVAAQGNSLPDYDSLIASFRKVKDRSAEQQRVRSLEQEVSSLNEQHAISTQQLKTANAATVKALSEENGQLVSQLHGTQDELEVAMREDHGKAMEIAVLRKRINELTTEALALTDSYASIEKQVAGLGQNLQKLDKEKQQLLAEKASLGNKINAQSNERLGLEAKISQLTEYATELEQKTSRLAQAIASLEAEKQSFIDTRQLLETERNRIALDFSRLEQEMTLLLQDNRAIEAGLFKCQQEVEQSVAVANESMALAAQLKESEAGKTRLLASQSEKIEELMSITAVLEKEKSSLQTRLNVPVENKAQTEALKTSQRKLREIAVENSQLLSQLHQAQEELEHYFILSRDFQLELRSVEERYQRIIARVPDYFDYDSIEVSGYSADEPGEVAWHIRGLFLAGKLVKDIELLTLVVEDTASLVLLAKDGDPYSPGFSWPHGTHTSSEWSFMSAVARLLVSSLKSPSSLRLPPELPVDPLLSALGTLVAEAEAIPAEFRYDAVALKHEQRNPDYEHLWLAFENPGFGNQFWPRFEFRLSASNIRPGSFGTHPKLEFPEGDGQTPFESWFIEASDDFGPKLEIRFALPEAMDISVWHQLSPHDQAFIGSLIAKLPSILSTLYEADIAPKRGMHEWLKLAGDIERILQVRIQPAAATSRMNDARFNSRNRASTDAATADGSSKGRSRKVK